MVKCDECGRSFKNKTGLSAHQRFSMNGCHGEPNPINDEKWKIEEKDLFQLFNDAWEKLKCERQKALEKVAMIDNQMKILRDKVRNVQEEGEYLVGEK